MNHSFKNRYIQNFTKTKNQTTMKKLSFLIIAFVLPFISTAQDSGDLQKKFYIRIGYSNPSNSYFGVEDNSFWDEVKKLGGSFEVGQIFMLNSMPLSDGLRLGINADYAEFTYHQLDFENDNSKIGVLQISSKVGPSISYSPVENLVLDAFIKLKISWVTGAAFVDDNLDIDEGYRGLFGVGYTTGLNVRYRFLMLGLEFNRVNMKLENVDVDGEYLGNAKDDGDKTPLPSMSFTFGFCF
jgi:hypothetical protein